MSEHADSDNSCWELGKRVCTSCEGYSRDVEDGLCPGCRGESSYDVERVKAATAIILGWKSERTLREELEANDWLEQHEDARRAYLAGRPGQAKELVRGK